MLQSVATLTMQLSASNCNLHGQAVRQLRLLNPGSNLANALNILHIRVFASNVARPGDALITEVVTDSQIRPSQLLTNEANSVKGQGVRVIAV